MKKILILALLLTIYASAPILEVTDKNFNEAINNNPYIVFLWHNNQESYDKVFPEFLEAEKIINEKNKVIFATVDAIKSKITIDRIRIDKFPYFSIFIDGKTFLYDSGFSTKDFVDYIIYKINPPIAEFKIVSELEEFIKNKEVAIFIGDTESENYKTFKTVAATIDDIIYLRCSTEECHFHYDVGYDGVVFNKGLEKIRKELTGKYNDNQLRELINDNKTPVYTKFNLDVSKMIFSDYNVGIFLYRNGSNPEHLRYDSVFRRASRLFKGAINFVITDIKGDLENQLAFLVRVQDKDLPCILIHDARKEDIKNFKLFGQIEEEVISAFIMGWGMNQIERYYKGELPPDEQTHPVETVVRSNFKEMVTHERKKDIFLYIWAEKCPYCDTLNKEFDKLGHMLKKDERIKLLKINGYENELDFEVEGYPTLILYQAGLNKKPIYFKETKRTIGELLQFLEKNLPYNPEVDLDSNIIEVKDFELDEVDYALGADKYKDDF